MALRACLLATLVGVPAVQACAADLVPIEQVGAEYAKPHQRIDVGGGRRMNLHCMGAGGSTVAHNVAWAIATALRQDSLILDMDLAFGTAGLNFNQDPPHGLADALSANQKVDQTMLDRLMSKAANHINLLSAPVTLEDPLAQEFVSWREKCHSTIRSTYQILSRGTPNLENETWGAAANVIRGTETPEAAAQRLQDGLASWYEPQKN